MTCEDVIDAATQAQDFTSGDFDICRLTFRTAERLVDEYSGVGKGETLALLTCGQKHCAHTHGHAYTYGRDFWLEPLHSVVDGETCVDYATGRVDVEVNILGCILALEEQQLGYGQVCYGVVDWCANEDDTLLQQARINVHMAFATRRLLNDCGNVYAMRLHNFPCFFDPLWVIGVKNATHLCSFNIRNDLSLFHFTPNGRHYRHELNVQRNPANAECVPL